MTVLQFPANSLDRHPAPKPALAGACPSWCARPADEPDHFHASRSALYVERDDENEPVFATRVTVEQLIVPQVVFRSWQATDHGSVEVEALLTPVEARTIARHLLEAADTIEATA